jgi:hypothetical protein
MRSRNGRRNTRCMTHSLPLVDTGLSPGAIITNAGRPGADLS